MQHQQNFVNLPRTAGDGIHYQEQICQSGCHEPMVGTAETDAAIARVEAEFE